MVVRVPLLASLVKANREEGEGFDKMLEAREIQRGLWPLWVRLLLPLHPKDCFVHLQIGPDGHSHLDSDGEDQGDDD